MSELCKISQQVVQNKWQNLLQTHEVNCQNNNDNNNNKNQQQTNKQNKRQKNKTKNKKTLNTTRMAVSGNLQPII